MGFHLSATEDEHNTTILLEFDSDSSLSQFHDWLFNEGEKAFTEWYKRDDLEDEQSVFFE